MNRKPELIMAWIANSISIIYLLVMGLSYFSLKSGNASQREELAKQLSQNGGNVSLDMLQTTMGALAIILQKYIKVDGTQPVEAVKAEVLGALGK